MAHKHADRMLIPVVAQTRALTAIENRAVSKKFGNKTYYAHSVHFHKGVATELTKLLRSMKFAARYEERGFPYNDFIVYVSTTKKTDLGY